MKTEESLLGRVNLLEIVCSLCMGNLFTLTLGRFYVLVLAVRYIVCCTLCLVSIFAGIHIWSNVDFSV